MPDHSVCRDGYWDGRNVLLVPTFTEDECLRAYRIGSFYGCLKDNGLTVNNFQVNDTQLSVATSIVATIRFITNDGEVNSVTGTEGVFDIPQRDGKPAIPFVRVVITDETGERLFLQPVMFN